MIVGKYHTRYRDKHSTFSIRMLIVLILITFTNSSYYCQRQPAPGTSTNNVQSGNLQVSLGAFTRQVPSLGYNGNAIEAPSFNIDAYRESVLALNPEVLRIPGGEISNFYDWKKDWINDKKPAHWQVKKSTTRKHAGINDLIEFNRNHPVEIAYTVNMYTSDLEYELEGLKYLAKQGVKIKYIELGNEFSIDDHEAAKTKYKDNADYFLQGNQWIKRLKKEFPDAEFGILAGNYTDKRRNQRWNQTLLENDKHADALIFHLYILNPPNKKTHSYESAMKGAVDRFHALYDVMDIKNASKEYDIWITEYNVFEVNDPRKFANTWSHALLVSYMNSFFLNNQSITFLCFHSLADWFVFAAIHQYKDGYPLTSAGVAMEIWGRALQGSEKMQQLKFEPVELITYTTEPGYLPAVFGWKFFEGNKEKVLLVNLSQQEFSMNLNSLFTKPGIKYETYHEAPFKEVNGKENMLKDKGDLPKTSLRVQPCSINYLYSTK